MSDIKERISALARSLGFVKFGFKEGAFVALFPYYVKGESGNISMYARGIDYHVLAEKKLLPIANELLALGADFAEVYADKGALDDRRAAYEAGLGFYGKNGMLICEELGSYFFIGQVVHNLEITPDVPFARRCLGCGRCIELCTGGALSDSGFDIERCVSHISQKKGELLESEKNLILRSGMCWGCDRCQEVCPHNARLDTTAMREFTENRITSLESRDFEGLTNRTFKEKFGSYAFSWRGKAVLVRNLAILDEGLGKGNKTDE